MHDLQTIIKNNEKATEGVKTSGYPQAGADHPVYNRGTINVVNHPKPKGKDK